MVKRVHAQAFAVDERKDAVANKRQLGTPPEEDQRALEILLENAASLMDTLQALQNASWREELQSKTVRDQILQGLRLTAQSVLPVFSHFANNGHQIQNSGVATLKDNTQKIVPSTVTDTQNESSTRLSCPGIPLPCSLTPFNLEDIPTVLPPLPSISNPVLENAAFTHSGMVQKPAPNYERLEWLGDAYTEVISSSLLYTTFGALPAGRLSQLRELLVKNATLGELAKHYGLMQRAKLPPDVLESKEKMKKVPGDIMEAYIAAVILSDPENGLQRAGEWLKAVFSVTIKDQIRSLSKRSDMNEIAEMNTKSSEPVSQMLPKTRLQTIIGASGIKLRYEDDPSGPKHDKYNKKLKVFTVNLYMDGWGEQNKWLGRGTDVNKKEAGQKAAIMAMNNTGLMKKYGQKKADFKAAQNEQGS